MSTLQCAATKCSAQSYGKTRCGSASAGEGTAAAGLLVGRLIRDTAPPLTAALRLATEASAPSAGKQQERVQQPS
jgi:hypothetical protein